MATTYGADGTRPNMNDTYGNECGYERGGVTTTMGEAHAYGSDGMKAGGTTGARRSYGTDGGNALDEVRDAFKNVVEDVKESVMGTDGTRQDDITYNQIHEAVPDPSADEARHGADAMGDGGDYHVAPGTSHDGYGSDSGLARGTRQVSDAAMGEAAARVSHMQYELDRAASYEREI